MICNEAHELLHGYVDGELDVVRSVQFEQHVQSCDVCSRQLANLRALRQAAQSPDLYYTAPAQLRRNIAGSLGSPARTPSRQFSWRALAIAASILFVATLGLTTLRSTLHDRDFLTAQVIDAHVRSMMVDHLSDVASTDQHTVKPWFNGKLDFSPPVIDTAGHGFPLVGGRLDYIDDRAVAALVYRRGQHMINLFIWPDSGAGSAPIGAQHHGYNLLHWTDSGMRFWAVSDLNAHELGEFAELLHAKTPTTSK